jgi:hypothetical protein
VLLMSICTLYCKNAKVPTSPAVKSIWDEKLKMENP